MFDERVSEVVDPPERVLVLLGRLLPPSRIRWGSDTPLWARAGGLQLAEPVQAELREWITTSVGDRVGVCSASVYLGGTERTFRDLLVPEALIRR